MSDIVSLTRNVFLRFTSVFRNENTHFSKLSVYIISLLFSTPFLLFTCFYNYMYNQCLSPLELWIRIPLRRGVLDTTLCDKVCQWLAVGRLFSPGTSVSSTNKTDRHDITKILLKVALNIITLTLTATYMCCPSSLIFHSRGATHVCCGYHKIAWIWTRTR